MFENRADAARQLVPLLEQRSLIRPLVLGIPRGGVVTAVVLAEALHADLDVVLARKLRAPGQPELALGAVGEDGGVYLTEEMAGYAQELRGYLDEERETQLKEIARRRRLFRAVRPAAPLAGRSVIVTDDGLATGSTMLAALHVARAARPYELIAAVPVAAPDRLELIRPACTAVVCLLPAPHFRSVGEFYADFTQVTDEEVVALLRQFAPRRPTVANGV